MRKDQLNPCNTNDAHAEDGQQRRRKGDAEAPEIAGHNLVNQTEEVGQHHHHQPDIAGGDHLRVTVENGKQVFPKEQNQSDSHQQRDHTLDQAKQQGLPAAANFTGTEVLPHKGGARLGKGIEDVIGDHLNVIGGAGGCHDHGAQAVDRRLNHNIGTAEYGTLQPGGKTDAENPAKHRTVDPQLFGDQVDGLGGAPKSAVEKYGTDAVGDHRSDCHTVDRHMQHRHKEQVGKSFFIC